MDTNSGDGVKRPWSSFFRYWGKSQSSEADTVFHLLPYHSLDVAAVGRLLLERNLFGSHALIARLTDDRESFIQWFTYILALHDIGKFARGFQSLRKDEHQALVPVDFNYRYGNGVRHDSLGFILWFERLFESFAEAGLPRHQKRKLANAMKIFVQLATGHHGQPPQVSRGAIPLTVGFYFADEDAEAAKAFMQECRFLLPPSLPAFLFDSQLLPVLKSLSWLLAGITTLADWLGSDKAVFQYIDTPMPLENYWQTHALVNAKRKLDDESCFDNVNPALFLGFDALFPGYAPTPLQDFCAECPLDSGPQLFILEDITGSGKTEAALALAQRLMAQQGQGCGLYVALPTMATSNAMFERMEQAYRRLFEPQQKPSLVLAHGARHLSQRFSEMVGLSQQKKDRDYDTSEQTATGWCNYWYVDNRKKSLLADVGVGTVDQALLSILPVRHQAMRLLGVANKILIIDEIHCFSEYESVLIQGLVKAHASFGGSTILLSATMPLLLRQKLVDAYHCGIGKPSAALRPDAEFPWVTRLGPNQGINEQAVASVAAVSRRVAVEYHDRIDELWQLIEQALAAGRSVCWIRNTVDETVACFDEATSRFATVAQGITLFHSRFCMQERIDIETDVLKRFGKQSTASERRGQLLISSPILDQSLDVDLSVMISDVAPMDVLIQRVGRCCRHLRDADENPLVKTAVPAVDGRGLPTLYLFGPKFSAEPEKNWLKDFSHGTQAIYQDTAKIWLTVKMLLDEQAIVMPTRARWLIESVYGADVIDSVPQALQDIHDEVEGEKHSETFLARFNQLSLEQGYSLQSNLQGWCDESQIPTRLAEDTVDFILFEAKGSALHFFADTPQHALDMSRISLRRTQAAACAPEVVEKYQTSLALLIEQYPQLKFSQPLILTAEKDGAYTAQAVDDKGRAIEVRYDRERGLRLDRSGSSG